MCGMTSNLKDVQDSAITRSGRISVLIEMGRPEVDTLTRMIAKYADDHLMVLHPDDIVKLAEKMEGTPREFCKMTTTDQ